jgi:hypothetical protein
MSKGIRKIKGEGENLKGRNYYILWLPTYKAKLSFILELSVKSGD